MAELAPPHRDVPPLEITLPGGEQVVVPFTCGFESDPVGCSTRDGFGLGTSLMFGVDDAVRAYMEAPGGGAEENGRVQIGYVYATIRFASFLHPGYASMDFWAATSGMSRLFERSASVRKVFTDLTAAAGGVCRLFDRGDGGPEEICWIDGGPTRETLGGSRFPDREALVATWPDPERHTLLVDAFNTARKWAKAGVGKVRVARAGALESRTTVRVGEVAISTQLFPSPPPE